MFAVVMTQLSHHEENLGWSTVRPSRCERGTAQNRINLLAFILRLLTRSPHWVKTIVSPACVIIPSPLQRNKSSAGGILESKKLGPDPLAGFSEHHALYVCTQGLWTRQ